MGFADIAGHENAIEMLTRADANGRLAHAYLFVGAEGIGKRLVAVNFAKALICAEGAGEPCDQCPSCRKIDAGNHVDVQVFAPKGLSRQLKVEQVQQFIQQVNLRPFEADRKVFVLCDAERANVSFQNKILKILEEPPDETVIILTSSNPEGLLPTIRSRCQIVNFAPLPGAAVEEHLISRGVNPEQARLAASLSQGQMGKALQWLDPELLRQRQNLFGLVTSGKVPAVEQILFCAGDLESYLRKKRDGTISAELTAAKKDPNWSNLDSTVRSDIEDNIKADAEGRFRQEASDVLNYLASFYRDVLLLRSTGREDMVMNADMLPAVRQGSETCDADGIMAAMRVIESTRESISRNVKISNCLEAMLLRLTAQEITGAHR